MSATQTISPSRTATVKERIMRALLPLSLLVALLSVITPHSVFSIVIPRLHLHTMRQQQNPNPSVGGSPETGWQWMPEVQDAGAYPNWIVDNSVGAVLPLYQTANQDYGRIKRAIIMLAGRGRDSWSYWNNVNNALYKAQAQDPTLVREDISLMSPCWWNASDLAAGAAKDDQLIWGELTWASGHYNVGPNGVRNFSSYRALDALVDHYMDRNMYPSLNTLVIAGHSAGAQMVQRYAALRISTAEDARIHYWVANPGSLLWLTPERPFPNNACAGVDSFKYGLSDKFPGYATGDAKRLGRDGIVERYRQRNVHYAWGTYDDGPGDTRCQAMTQGRNHIERGRAFVQMLENMNSGIPANHTVDWVEGISHDNAAMMNSAAGIEKLFKWRSQ